MNSKNKTLQQTKISVVSPESGLHKLIKQGFFLQYFLLQKRLLLGTPETRRKGRSTLKALSAFMSNPPPFSIGTPAILLMVSKAKVKRL